MPPSSLDYILYTHTREAPHYCCLTAVVLVVSNDVHPSVSSPFSQVLLEPEMVGRSGSHAYDWAAGKYYAVAPYAEDGVVSRCGKVWEKEKKENRKH